MSRCTIQLRSLIFLSHRLTGNRQLKCLEENRKMLVNHGKLRSIRTRGRNNKRPKERKRVSEMNEWMRETWEKVSRYFSRSLKTASPDETSSSKERSACTIRMLLSSKVLLFVVRFLYQLQRHDQVLLSVS